MRKTSTWATKGRGCTKQGEGVYEQPHLKNHALSPHSQLDLLISYFCLTCHKSQFLWVTSEYVCLKSVTSCFARPDVWLKLMFQFWPGWTGSLYTVYTLFSSLISLITHTECKLGLSKWFTSSVCWQTSVYDRGMTWFQLNVIFLTQIGTWTCSLAGRWL